MTSVRLLGKLLAEEVLSVEDSGEELSYERPTPLGVRTIIVHKDKLMGECAAYVTSMGYSLRMRVIKGRSSVRVGSFNGRGVSLGVVLLDAAEWVYKNNAPEYEDAISR